MFSTLTDIRIIAKLEHYSDTLESIMARMRDATIF